MEMLTGLFSGMVVQRNGRNLSEAAFSGTCESAGKVTARVSKDGRAVPGFAAAKVGTAARGRFSGILKGLPAGGPYEVELRIEGGESLRVSDVLVGDVWILGGQSNMQGVGLLKDGPKPDPMVRAFYMNDRWGVAKDPIHNLYEAVDQVHADLGGGALPARNTDWGVGPGVAFGQKMLALTGVPQGLLACAHGGTTMSQWDPKRKKLGSKSLYGAMVRRFKKNGSKVAGIVWYQGCSDANADAAPLYTRRMKELCAAMRRDFGRGLPIVIVQISRVTNWGPGGHVHWNSIQNQQRLLPEAIARCAVVPAIDLSLDDAIHISGRDQIRLGSRLARAMEVLLHGRRAGKPPIALRKVSLFRDRALGSVRVEFDHLEGPLTSGSRPAGFSLVAQDAVPAIFDVRLEAGAAIVRTTVPLEQLGDYRLFYGYGTNPYCNLTDSSDRAVPVFGPIPLGTPRALTPFIRTLRVSGFQPPPRGRGEAALPDVRRIGLKTRTFGTDFCSLRPEILRRAPEELVVYYACKFRCPEPMRLAAVLGYDGPVRVWLNGKSIFADPAGTNPAGTSDATIPLKTRPGENELLVRLGTHGGAAWGIFLRLERLGVPRAVLEKRIESVVMPEILG